MKKEMSIALGGAAVAFGAPPAIEKFTGSEVLAEVAVPATVLVGVLLVLGLYIREFFESKSVGW